MARRRTNDNFLGLPNDFQVRWHETIIGPGQALPAGATDFEVRWLNRYHRADEVVDTTGWMTLRLTFRVGTSRQEVIDALIKRGEDFVELGLEKYEKAN